jgi:tRNA threonylcarbamoyladenosine biosynthesis protein TsaE
MKTSLGPLDESGIASVVDYITSLNPQPRIITFTGDLGAGKTTLIRALLKAVNSNDEVSSPTFGIVNEYHTGKGRLVCHTDWYRAKSAEELLDAGLMEYIHNDDCLMLIEWPEVGAALLDGENCLHVHIEHRDNQRLYMFSDRLS